MRGMLDAGRGKFYVAGMRAWICAMMVCVTVLGLGLGGCSTTNDRGVNISRSTDLFGAATGQPASAGAAIGEEKSAAGAKS